jgi:class 3 adenylate cyclase
MQAKYAKYDFEASLQRVEEILSADTSEFKERATIPTKGTIKDGDGYYIDIGALFIDIRGSSDLTRFHKRPTLAKLYRAFISETIAILRSNKKCKELNIHGDCVWGVFEGSDRNSISCMFDTSIQLNTLIKELNYRFEKHKIHPIEVGIGLDSGRALLVKAGQQQSGVTELIWMGNVVNSACHLAGKGGKEVKEPIVLSRDVYNRLSKENQNHCRGNGLFTHDYYVADVIFTKM